jgi:opacity protein-like surface antigen
LVLGYCLVSGAPARADTSLSFDLDTTPPHFVSYADQQRWYVEILGNGMADVTNRHVGMGGLTGGVGYYFLDNLAINLDVSGYGFNEGRPSGAAVGVTLGLRHHLLNFGKLAFFVDVAGGIIEASSELPSGGTHLNNTFYVGPGVAYPIRDNVSLIGGIRYFHISNARSEGPDRNPSVNAIQGVVGVMFRF